MKVKQRIETSIVIEDPTSTYSNSAVNIREMLEAKFVGINYRGCHIKAIDKIIRISECMIENRGPHCNGKTTVAFVVDAVVINPGDVVLCKVVHRDRNVFALAADDTNGIMMHSDQFETIRAGQTLPVVAQSVSYTVGAKVVAVGFVPFVPAKVDLRYYVSGILSDANREEVKSEYQILLDEIEKRAASGTADSTAEKFFVKMLYPWAAIQTTEFAKTKLAELVLKTEYNGVYGRDPTEESCSVTVTEYPLDDGDAVRGLDPMYALIAIIRSFAAAHRLLREFMDVYGNDTTVTEHKNLWQIYHRAKK